MARTRFNEIVSGMAAVLAACVLLFVPLVLLGSYALATNAPAEAVASPTVQVLVIGKNEGGGRAGTAFHVGGGRFYTNGHVAETIGPSSGWGPVGWWIGGEMWVNVPSRVTGFRFSRDDTYGPATELCKDPRWQVARHDRATPFDFASFKIASVELPAYRLASADPQVGDRVKGEGYASASNAWPPKMYEWVGTVLEARDGDLYISVKGGFALPGSSGSPILNEAGKVVGVVYSSDQDGRTPAAHIWAVPVSAVQSSTCR